MLPVQTGVDDALLRVEHPEQGLRVPRQTCREHDDLKVWSNGLKELITPGSLSYVYFLVHNLVRNVRYVDNQFEIGQTNVGRLELRVDQCLIKVQNERLHATLMSWLLA